MPNSTRRILYISNWYIITRYPRMLGNRVIIVGGVDSIRQSNEFRENNAFDIIILHTQLLGYIVNKYYMRLTFCIAYGR